MIDPLGYPRLPQANEQGAIAVRLRWGAHRRAEAPSARRWSLRSDTISRRRPSLGDIGPDLSDFQRQMRDWAGFKTGTHVSGHNVRITPRDFEIFRKMPPGADYPRALKIAEAIFEERLEAEDQRPRPGSSRWKEIRKACIPPYDPGKFPNKWCANSHAIMTP